MCSHDIIFLAVLHPTAGTNLSSYQKNECSSNGHFPGGPRLAGTRMFSFWILLELRIMKVVSGDNWSYNTCKAPVKSSPPTNQHPTFYRSDVLPVAQPTVWKHWRENITFHRLAYPKLTWGLPTLSLTTNSSSCYLGEGCHASHQPSDASRPTSTASITKFYILKFVVKISLLQKYTILYFTYYHKNITK